MPALAVIFYGWRGGECLAGCLEEGGGGGEGRGITAPLALRNTTLVTALSLVFVLKEGFAY